MVARARQHLLGQLHAALVEHADAGDGHLEDGRLERGEHRGEANHQREEEHRRAVDIQQPRVAPFDRQQAARNHARAAEVQDEAAQRDRFSPARFALDDHRPARRHRDRALDAIQLLQNADQEHDELRAADADEQLGRRA